MMLMIQHIPLLSEEEGLSALLNERGITERIDVIDIIRGFAVFGICLVNIPEMFGNGIAFRTEYEGSDALFRLLYDMFVQTKFYTIFAFLFGVSFHLFIQSAQRRGLAPGWPAARRLTALFIFGAAHAVLLWFGDILHPYALFGLLLLFFIHRRDITVAAWGWSCFGLAVVIHLLIGLAMMFMTGSEPIEPTFASPPDMAGRINYLLTTNLINMPVYGVELLGLFLLGMYAGRKGWFIPGAVKKRTLALLQWSSLAAGLLAALPMAWHYINHDVYRFDPHYIYTFLSGKLLAVFYVVTLMRFTSRLGSGRFRALAAVGRMAFTNYLTQTIITMTVLRFIWQDAAEAPLWAAFLWSSGLLALQTLWSVRWLARYRLGPFEWVWRLLTCRRVPAMRRNADA